MKYLAFLVGVLLLLPGVAQAATIVSCWSMDEASGTAFDTLGVNNLTDNNTVTRVAGKIANAADFESANSEYFSIADASQTGLDFTSDFSVMWWQNIESKPGSYMYAVVNKDVGQPERSYGVFDRDVAGATIDILLSTDGTNANSNNYRVSATQTIGTYEHYAMVYDSAAGSMQVYRNGTSAGTAATSMGIYNSTAEFRVGRGASTNYMDGTFDELGIYSGKLTGAEVTTDYNGGTGTACSARVPAVTPPTPNVIFFN